MKLNVSLFDKKSYKSAINQVKNLRDITFPQMRKEFLKRCCEKIIELAKQELLFVDIGDLVKSEISYSWEYEISDNKARLINTSDKAVYVEFGVGVVGGESPHPMATESGYQYNVPSGYKMNDNSWIFHIENDESLDISSDNILARKNEHLVMTRGQKGYMYLFNAVEDFKTNGYAKDIWNELKKEYGV